MRQTGVIMNLSAYIASRPAAEQRKLLAVNRTGNHHAATAGSCIHPPRDVMATKRYKLPTKKEVFTYGQQYGDQVKQILPTLRPLN